MLTEEVCLVCLNCRYRHLDEYPCEEFTEVYWIKFCSIAAARYCYSSYTAREWWSGVSG